MHPLTSGQTAHLLGSTEPRLNDLVRRGRINPPPPVVSGRRRWSREHVKQAAQLLGVPHDRVERLLNEDKETRRA